SATAPARLRVLRKRLARRTIGMRLKSYTGLIFSRSVLALSMALAAFAAAVPSPVADAAAKGEKAAVRTLLQQKADVNAPQADGATAIQWAAYRNDPELADILIAAGAN